METRFVIAKVNVGAMEYFNLYVCDKHWSHLVDDATFFPSADEASNTLATHITLYHDTTDFKGYYTIQQVFWIKK